MGDAHIRSDQVTISSVGIARPLHDFMVHEALPGTGVTPERFWTAYAAILRDLAPRNADMLARRDELQARIDAW